MEHKIPNRCLYSFCLCLYRVIIETSENFTDQLCDILKTKQKIKFKVNLMLHFEESGGCT